MKAGSAILLVASIVGFMLAMQNIGKAPKELPQLIIFALSWFLAPTILMVAGIELWNRAWKKAKNSRPTNPPA